MTSIKHSTAAVLSKLYNPTVSRGDSAVHKSAWLQHVQYKYESCLSVRFKAVRFHSYSSVYIASNPIQPYLFVLIAGLKHLKDPRR